MDGTEGDGNIVLACQRRLWDARVLLAPPVPQPQKTAQRQVAIVLEQGLESLDVGQRFRRVLPEQEVKPIPGPVEHPAQDLAMIRSVDEEIRLVDRLETLAQSPHLDLVDLRTLGRRERPEFPRFDEGQVGPGLLQIGRPARRGLHLRIDAQACEDFVTQTHERGSQVGERPQVVARIVHQAQSRENVQYLLPVGEIASRAVIERYIILTEPVLQATQHAARASENGDVAVLAGAAPAGVRIADDLAVHQLANSRGDQASLRQLHVVPVLVVDQPLQAPGRRSRDGRVQWHVLHRATGREISQLVRSLRHHGSADPIHEVHHLWLAAEVVAQIEEFARATE